MRQKNRIRYSGRFPPHPYSSPALDTAPAESFRRDARVIGVVSLAHGVSHFLQLPLPPLSPLRRAEFDLPCTLLGLGARAFDVPRGPVPSPAALPSARPPPSRPPLAPPALSQRVREPVLL